jgi:hypothetical protein
VTRTESAIPGGSFTLDGGRWLDNPPSRSELTVAQLSDLLALALAGCPLPARYGYRDGRDVLSDLSLAAQNEASRLRDRVRYLDADSLSARTATSGAWRLVWDAGKRKTIRTDDLRAVLDGARP